MRIASYNVENLFARAKALNRDYSAKSQAILDAHARVNDLFLAQTYDTAIKSEILLLLRELGVLGTDRGEFVWLRKIRGQLLLRPRDGPVTVVASGRDSWTGWVELKTEEVDELAIQHTAKVIREVNADVLGVVEADSRPVLQLFADRLVKGARPYEQVMLIDGNDERGIDVGLLTRRPYEISHIRTHVFDTDSKGVIFSRDCAEYHLRNTQYGADVVVLVNHLKSKRSSEKDRWVPNAAPARQDASPRYTRTCETLAPTWSRSFGTSTTSPQAPPCDH